MTPASRSRSSAAPSRSSGIIANGTPEQIGEWVPQCFGTPEKIQLGAFCVSEPDAGSDVSSLRTRAVYDEAKDEWVLNGTKTWITNGGIADVHVVVASVEPELGGRGQASFVVPPGHAGSDAWARSSRSTASAPATPPRSSSTTCASPGRCLLGGKEKLDERLARAREGGSSRGAGRDEDVRGDAPARRRAGASASPAPRTSTRSTTPRSACSSAGRSSRTRPSRSSSPT